jgi:hypothetical protein
MRTQRLITYFLLAGCGAARLAAQSAKVLAPEDLFRRNVGTREQQIRAIPAA